MKFLKFNLFSLVILFTLVSLQACKPKKVIQKTPPADTTKQAPPVQQPAPQPTPPPPPAPTPPPAPDYNFSNIQFEFDSGVLKTDSYPILDKAAAEMKKDPSVKFILKGYASIEGTPEHNIILSQDRANSVKVYLVNTGVSANQLTAKGYGVTNPIADNNTEAGKILNRRVEIKVQN
jgi:OOP family OmpA-OmpF porin